MTAQEVIERIMSAHWDMTVCPCWICRAGRRLGYAPREEYMPRQNQNRKKYPAPSGEEFWRHLEYEAAEAGGVE